MQADVERLLSDARFAADRGDFPGALSRFVQARLRSLQSLGPRHPRILALDVEIFDCELNVGVPKRTIDEALALSNTADSARGPDDPVTLKARQVLARTLARAGRIADALAMREALAARYAALGLGAHPDALRNDVESGLLLADLGRKTDAMQRLAAARDATRERLGSEHYVHRLATGYLANELLDAGRLREAIGLYRELGVAERAAQAGTPTTFDLFLAGNQALALRALGRLEDAAALTQPLLARAPLPALRGPYLSLMRTQSLVLLDLGRVDEALQLGEDILRTAREDPNTSPQVVVRLTRHLGMLQQRAGRWDDAEASLRAASAEADRLYGARSAYALETARSLAELVAQRRPGEGLRLYAALRERLRGVDTAGQVADITELEWLKLRVLTGEGASLGAELQALESRLRRRYGETSKWTLQARALGIKAALLTGPAAGRETALLPALEALVGAVEEARKVSAIAVADRRTWFREWLRGGPAAAGYLDLARLYAQAGRADDALRVLELVKSRTLAELIQQRRADRQGLIPAEAQDQLEELDLRIASLHARVAQAAGDAEKRLALETERNALLREQAALRARLVARHPAYGRLAAPRQASAGEVRRRLRADEAAVSFAVSDDGILAVVLRPDRPSTVRMLGPFPGLADGIEAYRHALRGDVPRATRLWRRADGSFVASIARPEPTARPTTPEALGAVLAQRLVAPLMPLLGGVHRLLVSGDGPLWMLPLEALPSPTGHGWLVEDFELRYASSLSTFVAQRERTRPASRRDAALLALGGADYGAGWSPLPYSDVEVRGIAALFPPGGRRLLLGEAASEANLRALDAQGALARYRYLHLATHGTFSAREAEDSAIVLSRPGGADERAHRPENDGRVTAAEWAGMRLDSELVVLSACDTGMGEITPGEGLVGLPYALFAAGAHGTLLSLWSVEDDGTAAFMKAFYARLRAGHAPARALVETKRAFLRSGAHARPQQWAPFLLFAG